MCIEYDDMYVGRNQFGIGSNSNFLVSGIDCMSYILKE